MAILKIKEKPFRFMDFPQEIRDRVYHKCLITANVQIPCKVHLTVGNATAINLLLVSKRIKAEAEDCKRFQICKFIVSDDIAFSYGCDPYEVNLPDCIADISILQIRVLGAIEHGTWMEHIIEQLPNLTDLSVLMVTGIDPCKTQGGSCFFDRKRGISKEGYEGLLCLTAFDIWCGNGIVAGSEFDLTEYEKVMVFDPEMGRFRALRNLKAARRAARWQRVVIDESNSTDGQDGRAA